MATVVKDFKVKAGLIVEGTTAKVNNFDVLTKATADQNYIIGLIGGSATNTATPDTVVLRDENADFSANVVTADLVGDVTGSVSGNAGTATTLETARTIQLTGEVTGSVSFNGSQNVQISTTIDADFATDAEVATAKSEAISEASSDATTKADAAEAAAISAASSDATTKADAAEDAANLYTDGKETAITTAYQSYADTAEADAISTAAGDATTKANTAEGNAKGYTDDLIGDASVDGTGGNTVTDRIASAVSLLVDSSPETLDTLNELAAALGDDPNFATTVSTSIGTKVSKAGDSMTGDLTLAQDPTSNLHAATKQYVDAAETDARAYTDTRETAITTAYQSYADTAEADAISTAAADATSKANTAESNAVATASSDATSKANTAESNANAYTDTAVSGVNTAIGNLDTDDIAEGSNEYFTDERAQDAVAAAIAAGTHSNITITYNDSDNSISFAAENGVADSTTTDLTEGTNLYFTDTRAVDALEAVVPDFTEIDINSVATQVAATSTVETASQAVAYTFAGESYRSAKLIVKVAYGTHTEVSEVLLTLDTSDNIAITEYAVVGTNGSASTISAGMSGTDVQLLVTTTNNNSTITVMGTLLV